MAAVFHAKCISAIPALRRERQSPVTLNTSCVQIITKGRDYNSTLARTPVSHSLNSKSRFSLHSRGVDRCQDGRVRCSASNDAPPPVYKGMYGDWSVEDSDKLEVTAYRVGLVTSATSFCLAASTAFLPPDSPLHSALLPSLDTLYYLGAGSLGLSLALIHIYVTPIKRTLQALWLLGVLGSGALALNFAGPAGEGLVEFTLENGAGVWAVGPLFAALTGLVFKEGLCYGKVEAALLFFIIPSLMLGHLSGVMDVGVEKGLLGLWMGLFALFAARKFTQPIKDDLGDKSVFIFQALSKEKQEALIKMLEFNSRENQREV